MVPFSGLDQVILLLLAGLLVYAALRDLDSCIIPNRVSVSVAALYPAYVIANGLAVDWLPAVGIALMLLLFGVILFARGIFGGGDVKLLAATALWAGPDLAAWFLIITGLVGGLMAVAMMSPLNQFLALAADRIGWSGAQNPFLRYVLPYGVAIASGGLFVIAVRSGFVAMT